MRISQFSGAYKNRRSVEAASREFEDRLNLLSRHILLFDDFFDARTNFKAFKDRRDRHPGIFKHPCAATSFRHAFHGGTL